MTTEIKVPVLPESIADAVIAKWHKQPGDSFERDETLVELETDKVMLEVPAPSDGVLKEILKKEGTTVTENEVIGSLDKDGASKAKSKEKKAEAAKPTEPEKEKAVSADMSPAVRRLVSEHDLDVEKIKGTGKGGRITKEDVMAVVEKGTEKVPAAEAVGPIGERAEKRVPMSRLRARVAERLVSVGQETAMLTTFNEINMKPVMDLRAKYKDKFEKTHGIKLGLMSFFVKAAVEALKKFPAVNASIDGDDIVYHGYFDIGIAVSTERGLMVPVLRDVDQMSMADIEKGIRNYAEKARNNKITLDDMTGGTFTITNGGVFGSMLSTPILNPPQSAILGMHNIVKRAVVEGDDIVVRPIMYAAISYDHRIIDGRESVTFLVTMKELLEDPAKFLLDL